MRVDFSEFNKSGIYFLINRKTIVYIGQTKRYPFRFNLFNSSFCFDRMRFIECDKSDLLKYEKRWIVKFNPKYNKIHNIDYNFHRLGEANPNAGRRKGTIFDKLKVSETMQYKGKSHPAARVQHFNKTRKRKLTWVLDSNNVILIKRIK